MKKAAKKSTWGGVRPNQTGRPRIGKKKKVTVSICIDPDILPKIDAYAQREDVSRSIAIERLIGKALNILRPKK